MGEGQGGKSRSRDECRRLDGDGVGRKAVLQAEQLTNNPDWCCDCAVAALWMKVNGSRSPVLSPQGITRCSRSHGARWTTFMSARASQNTP